MKQLGLADEEAVAVKLLRQEDALVLVLEAVKTLTMDGTQARTIDPRMSIIQTDAQEEIKGDRPALDGGCDSGWGCDHG